MLPSFVLPLQAIIPDDKNSLFIIQSANNELFLVPKGLDSLTDRVKIFDTISSCLRVGDTLYLGFRNKIQMLDINTLAVKHTFHGCHNLVNVIVEHQGKLIIAGEDGYLALLSTTLVPNELSMLYE